MTSKQVAFTKGTGFDSIAGTPTYFRPGYDVTVEELSLENNPSRRRQEDTIEPIESQEGIFRAFLTVSYSMSNTVHDDVRDIIFNNGGTGLTTGQPAFSRWFVGSKYFDTSLSENTVELELRSGIPLSYGITYEVETNTIRERLRLGFADVRKNASFTPSSITGPALDSAAAFHGLTLTIDGNTVNRDQAMSLEFPEPMSRFQDESSRNAPNAVANAVNPTLSSTVVYHTDDYLGLNLSGDDTTATQPQGELGDVSGSAAFTTADGTTIATYSFSRLLQPTWGGQNLASHNDDFLGVANWNVDGGVSIS